MDIDIHLNGRWHACARVDLESPDRASRRDGVRLQYEANYAVEHLGATDYRALTVHAPVHLGIVTRPQWPSFLIDLLPQGAARKRLERNVEGPLTEWELLERGAVNPVGNLRVRPRAGRTRGKHPGFKLSEMTSRGDAFIDYAGEVGATVAGATDTQGEAPKFWVVQDAAGRWHPDDGEVSGLAKRYALLKFPVPEAGPRAEDILRNEAAYQRVGATLGLRVTDQVPQFVDGALLVPRFDRRIEKQVEVRLGVESLYSIAGVLDSAVTPLRHHEALIALHACLTDFEAEASEYVKRDLLNIALGNRDNHGRNTAVVKDTDGAIRLAPLYDFGPAYLDARAIARVMRWDAEAGSRRDWNAMLENVKTYFAEAEVPVTAVGRMAETMAAFAADLDRLPQVMRACKVDASIIKERQPEIEQLAGELRAIRTGI